MNRSGIRKTSGSGKRDILFNTKRQGYGVQVAATGVTNKNEEGQLIIYAGQALGGATDPRVDRQAVLTLNTDGSDTIYGVTQHDIVFLKEDEICNANLLYMATIDTSKMDPKVRDVPDAVKEALQAGGPTKVIFVNGGNVDPVNPVNP